MVFEVESLDFWRFLLEKRQSRPKVTILTVFNNKSSVLKGINPSKKQKHSSNSSK